MVFHLEDPDLAFVIGSMPDTKDFVPCPIGKCRPRKNRRNRQENQKKMLHAGIYETA